VIELKWAGKARPFQGFAWGKTLGALTRGGPLARLLIAAETNTACGG